MSNGNVYSKLQKCRVELKAMNLKKTGINKYKDKNTGKLIEKFKYYELADFLPHIIDLFDKYNLYSQVNFTKENAELIILDTENPDVIVRYTTNSVDAELIKATKIQELGATQTYLRRYLYINALEIVENDIVDSLTDEEKEEMQKEKVIDKSKAKVIGMKADGNIELAKGILSKFGYNSTVEVKLKDFKKICDEIEKAVKNLGKGEIKQ